MKTLTDYELQIHELSINKDVVKVEYSIVDDYGTSTVKRTMSTEPLLNWVNENVDSCSDCNHYLSDNLFYVVKEYLNANL